ncbi:MAG: hypothetical protein ABIQ88_06020 [Chitinophagaceae bacterium]
MAPQNFAWITERVTMNADSISNMLTKMPAYTIWIIAGLVICSLVTFAFTRFTVVKITIEK